MTIQQRPTPLRPQIDSWTELSKWVDKRLESVESDLADGETMQSLGQHGEARLKERRATLLDFAWAIGPMVAAEEAEHEQVAAEDSVEQQFKDHYGPEPIAPWQAEGR